MKVRCTVKARYLDPGMVGSFTPSPMSRKFGGPGYGMLPAPMKDVLYQKAKKAISWLKKRPEIHWLHRRAPRTTRFIIDRFDPKLFVGLPLTLIALVFTVNLALLSQLTENVIESEEIVDVDQRFTSMLFEIRSGGLSEILLATTKLADRSIVLIVIGIVSAIFIIHKKWIAWAAFCTALLGVGLSTHFGKTYFSRARPADVAYYSVDHFSFPSGHATTAMALYGLIAYFLFRHYHRHPKRLMIIWIAAVVIGSIGFSRIYLGVHFLSDVLAGYLLGVLWLLAGISWMEVMDHRKKSAGKNHFRTKADL